MKKKLYIKPRAVQIDLTNESLLAAGSNDPDVVTASYGGDDNGGNGGTPPEADAKSNGRIIWDD